MKVLCFTSSLTQSTTFIYHQLKQLNALGVNVKMLIFNDNSNGSYIVDYSLLPKETKLEYLLATLINRKKLGYRYFNFRFERAFKKHINSFSPDLILIHFGSDLVKISDFLKKKDIPIVTIFHGFDASSLLRNPFYRKKIRNIFKHDNFFASCVAYDMISRFNVININIKNFSFNHLGVDTEYFNCDNDLVRTNDFLQVSNFVEKKGHEVTIKAFHDFKKQTNSTSKLILAGDGPRINLIKEIVKELDLNDSVEILGSVTIQQVKQLMNKCKYFVHHSITDSNGDQEGIPTVLMEAISMRMMVVSTFHSGIPELVTKYNGILVKENSIEEMSLAFKNVSALQATSRITIEENFNIKTNTNKFVEYLLSIID